MDQVDRKILCELDRNCRTPVSQIAKRLKIGRNVVSYRINKLEKEGIIFRYIASMNLGRLGFQTYKIYFHTSPTEEDRFKEKLEKEEMRPGNRVREEAERSRAEKDAKDRQGPKNHRARLQESRAKKGGHVRGS